MRNLFVFLLFLASITVCSASTKVEACHLSYEPNGLSVTERADWVAIVEAHDLPRPDRWRRRWSLQLQQALKGAPPATLVFENNDTCDPSFSSGGRFVVSAHSVEDVDTSTSERFSLGVYSDVFYVGGRFGLTPAELSQLTRWASAHDASSRRALLTQWIGQPNWAGRQASRYVGLNTSALRNPTETEKSALIQALRATEDPYLSIHLATAIAALGIREALSALIDKLDARVPPGSSLTAVDSRGPFNRALMILTHHFEVTTRTHGPSLVARWREWALGSQSPRATPRPNVLGAREAERSALVLEIAGQVEHESSLPYGALLQWILSGPNSYTDGGRFLFNPNAQLGQ